MTKKVDGQIQKGHRKTPALNLTLKNGCSMCVAKLVYEAAKTYVLTRPDREERLPLILRVVRKGKFKGTTGEYKSRGEPR